MKARPFVLSWLVVGLVMVYFQIIIGGITRLTGSGLSITKWEIVTGTLPPLSNTSWETEFEKYKATPQYSKINEGMSLGSSIFDPGSFKFIYFWEYLHRLWARTMGIVFLVPFLLFNFSGWLSKGLKKHLGIVVFFAALAAVFGWIMVASGLINRPWVNAYKLAVHLSLGISVFLSLLWTVFHYKWPYFVDSLSSVRVSWKPKLIMALLAVQVFFGGIMSGMKAAIIFPTWPDIGGEYIPYALFNMGNWSLENFVHYEKGPFVFLLVHIIHRTLAYVIVGVVLYYFISEMKYKTSSLHRQSFNLFAGLVGIQILLGILTLVQSIGKIPVGLGVMHQGVGVLVIGSFLAHYYFLKVREVELT